MYHQFNIHKSYVLPTQCIYVFCVGLRTNNDYFLNTTLTDWFSWQGWRAFTARYGLGVYN